MRPEPTFGSIAKTSVVVAIAAIVLGVGAQFLRQMPGPAMALGAATAPWLTVGFLLALRATRETTSLGRAIGLGIATTGLYLVLWLLAYHVTYAIRESVTQAGATREAAPWLLLAAPISLVLGAAAALAHRRTAVRELCMALPIAWSMPEITASLDRSLTSMLVLAVPTGALALSPVAVVGARNLRLLRLAVAGILFTIAGVAILPVVQAYITRP